MLGTLGGTKSAAIDINGSGQVVGNYHTGSGDIHAFVHDGTMIDLNDLIAPGSGWTIQDAYAINDNG